MQAEILWYKMAQERNVKQAQWVLENERAQWMLENERAKLEIERAQRELEDGRAHALWEEHQEALVALKTISPIHFDALKVQHIFITALLRDVTIDVHVHVYRGY
jgi:hypothetical protein